jgi:hypothetical protein
MSANQQVSTPTVTELPTPRDTRTPDKSSTLASADLTEAQRSVALTWVARGIPVIPCSRTDKGPMVAGFRKDATAEEIAQFSDPAQVRGWWSGRFKRAHVGLLTGRGHDGRGLVVVDLDIRKPDVEVKGEYADVASGMDVLERIAASAGADWPETYTVLTPSGGVHLVFRQPVEGPLIGCATGAGPTAPHLGPLIDVRGLGGLVIAAGSYSAAQGLPYRRISDPGLVPQLLPAWLLSLLRPSAVEAPARAARPRVPRLPPAGSRAERYATVALDGEVAKVAAAPDGTGNRRLFSAARRLGELSSTAPAILAETAVYDQLLSAAVSAGHPERGAVRTIRSGWERGVRDGLGGAA